MRKMTIRTKLIIMGICAFLILAIFVVNVVRKYNVSDDEIILRDGEMITYEEVEHLLYYLGIEEGELEYKVNSKEDYVTFDNISKIMSSLEDKLDLDMEQVAESLTFQIKEEKENKAVLVSEFLEIYELVFASMPEENSPVKEEEFFVVGIADKYKMDSNRKIMSTNQGSLGFGSALDYGFAFVNGELIKEDNKDKIKENIDGEQDQENSRAFNIEDYIDHKISAIVAGDEIVYVKGTLNKETILYNAWIVTGSGQKVNSFVHEVSKEFNTKSILSEEINGVVGDLIVQDQEIIGIRIKPDRINGKVLVTDKEYIEIEGYGQIPLDENYKIYKMFGELAEELTNSILVGYESTDFIVAEGKIVAALIKEEIKAENIRVLIKTNGFNDYYHNEVSFTSNDEFTLVSGEEEVTHQAGTVINVKVGDETMAGGRITIKPNSENGRIQILSLDRAYGNPLYRGRVEIAPSDSGLLIVNELSLEEYLYAVVPSEMPSSYGIEALKSQAVCARSYALNHLMANSLNQYGAHVDDSVSFQVYNNIEENENTILAVKDTYGKVMTHGGLVITAYYFSTSCGHTASVGEVWSGNQTYLTGKPQTIFDGDGVPVTSIEGEVVEAQVLATSLTSEVDFSNEETFRSFILNPVYQTYDSEFAWYRWKVNLPYDALTESINSRIASRYNANPEYIQALVTNEAGDQAYESQPIESIGTLEDVQISARQKSGIITEIILMGSEKQVKVIGEYNIRTLLSPEKQNIIRQDSSEVSQAMLPSAFFVMDKGEGVLTITGGGYGHGVGMSQNGAKAMADQGKEYEEILQHYYSGVELGYIYE